ncbi:MAG: MBL fold metallo-hydrolase [Pseudomonadota bacterium]
MKKLPRLFPAALLVLAVTAVAAPAEKTLDIYFIDVEGGQSTLLVTATGESMLIDAGFPGAGAFQSKPGDPNIARDPQRIADVAHAAGLSHIDVLLTTHFHADHAGGIPELAQLIPIRTFVDHGDVVPTADQNVPGTVDVFKAYVATRAGGRHLAPKPGDRLPLKSIDAVIVSAAGRVISKPLARAGGSNQHCVESAPPAQETNENPQSLGVLIQYGRFRFLDVGDLTGQPLFDLVCPKDSVGPVDVYLVAHHGGADAADPATFAALKPRAAILNNGQTKGGAPALLASLHVARDVQSVWQLHRTTNEGAENFPDDHIANLDETTAHWIKVSATADGAFRVMNGRTRVEAVFPARESR